MSLTIIPLRQFGPISIGFEDSLPGFNPLYPEVTVEERHRDVIAITRHPVEKNAAITDHTYVIPSEVIITAGWSNGAPENTGGGGLLGGITSVLGTGGSEEFITVIYAKLLELQASGVPFDLFTGKRDYANMLIRELQVDTDQQTETTLMVRAICEQVIIVSTQTVNIAPQNSQFDPKKTNPPVNAGPQQLRTLPPGAVPPT